MVEFGTSSAFRGWVRVRVLGHGFGVRGRNVKSRDCALASDLVARRWPAAAKRQPRARSARRSSEGNDLVRATFRSVLFTTKPDRSGFFTKS